MLSLFLEPVAHARAGLNRCISTDGNPRPRHRNTRRRRLRPEQVALWAKQTWLTKELAAAKARNAPPIVGRTAGHTDVSLWYVLHADREQPIEYDRGEFNAVRWFSIADVPLHRSDPHMHRFLRKLAQCKETPGVLVNGNDQ